MTSETAGLAPTKSRYMPWLVLGVVLCVLGLAIALTTLHLRKAMREQIIGQDGMALYATSFVHPSLLEGLAPEIQADPAVSFAALADQMFETASNGGAIAVRLFDAHGQLQMTIPLPTPHRNLSATEMAAVSRREPVSSYEPAAEMSDFGLESGKAPILLALVPLDLNGVLLGSAEFVLHGDKVASRLATLDSDLLRYSLLTFIVTGGFIAGSLGWTFLRLNKTNRLLRERTQSLLRANHELSLTAKTSAIGAITAHLIHDLKSPLFGLQSFVSLRGRGDDEDWELAADAAERMQKLIGEIVRILQEEKTSETYEFSVDELFDVLRNKVNAEATKKGVELVLESQCAEIMDNHEANIVLLVLTNLVQNAIQATPAEGRVSIRAERTDAGAAFAVTDTGPGLPASVLPQLFTPCRSSKASGTGIGLAISKHLSNHLGADLRLKQTSPEGTTFELRVPSKVFASAPSAQSAVSPVCSS